MPACPVCETQNPHSAVECARCGKVLRSAAAVPGFAPPVEGLEPTLQPPVRVDVEPVAGIEATRLVGPGLQVATERLTVERTPHESNGAPVNWVPGQLEIERGREMPSAERTPLPSDSSRCPWCGAISQGALCDTCGRTRARSAAVGARGAAAEGDEGRQSESASAGDFVLCPACLARVSPGIRCVECGVPLPPRER
jgi:hypothetical protein